MKQPLQKVWPKSLTLFFFLSLSFTEHDIMLPFVLLNNNIWRKAICIKMWSILSMDIAWIGFHRSNKGIVYFFFLCLLFASSLMLNFLLSCISFNKMILSLERFEQHELCISSEKFHVSIRFRWNDDPKRRTMPFHVAYLKWMECYWWQLTAAKPLLDPIAFNNTRQIILSCEIWNDFQFRLSDKLTTEYLVQ